MTPLKASGPDVDVGVEPDNACEMTALAKQTHTIHGRCRTSGAVARVTPKCDVSLVSVFSLW